MNKAFVKESDDPHDHCPSCGAIGTTVQAETLEAHLKPELRSGLAESAYFCPTPTCDIAYFDQFEQTILVEDLSSPIYPKDPTAQICPCFGLTCEDIEADVEEGGVTRIKAHYQRANSDEARCSTKSADGRSCLAAVQRYFMRLRGG